MSSPAKKRRRVDISASQKRDVCLYKEQHPKATQAQILVHFSNEWGVSVGRSTISDILRDKVKWLSVSKDCGDVLRAKTAMHIPMESALYTWFADVRGRGLAISDDMMITKAKEYGQKLGVTDFQYSRGWLAGFKKRHGIRLYKCHGEAGSAQATVVQAGREQLREDLRDFSPRDVYNFDETGLFYRLEPNATLATAPVPGKKKSKDRLSVGLCSNADGSDKLKPVVIGKAAKPRCFSGGFDPSVYAEYYSNKTAWMVTSVFQTWLQGFDRRMRLAKRQVCLLMDNATSHSTQGLKLTNITVKFLPPNTTAHIQPLDAGIIRNLKLYYRRYQTHHFLECIEKDQPMTVNVRQALRFVHQAWGDVKAKTIANCWRHVNILPSADKPPTDTDSDSDDDIPLQQLESDDDIPLQQLRNMMAKIPDATMTAEEYIHVDATVETSPSMTDDAILEMVRESDTPENSDSESDDDEAPPPRVVTGMMAKNGLADVLTYMENQPSYAHRLPELLSIMKDLKTISQSTCSQSKISDFFTH